MRRPLRRAQRTRRVLDSLTAQDSLGSSPLLHHGALVACHAMQLKIVQRFGATGATSIINAYRSEALYRSFADLPFVGSPEFISLDTTGADRQTIKISNRLKVSVDLPSAANAFVDGDKLTFVERSEVDIDGTGRFEVDPDHYDKLLSLSGQTKIAEIDGVTTRTTTGTLAVDLGWAGRIFKGAVEQAIANGLDAAFQAQIPQVGAFIANNAPPRQPGSSPF